jgi:hypothetical protein
MALTLMEYQLHIKQEIIRQIPHEDFAKRKICLKFFPHTLSQTSKRRKKALSFIAAWWRSATHLIYLTFALPIVYTPSSENRSQRTMISGRRENQEGRNRRIKCSSWAHVR